MILIQSSSDDHSTNDVLDWIHFLSSDSAITRIDDNTFIEQCTFKIQSEGGISSTVYSNGNRIDIDELQSYWYRRGESYLAPKGKLSTCDYSSFSLKVAQFINVENQPIKELFNHYLSNAPKKIGNFSDNSTNKLINLHTASSVGLQIPNTIITNDTEEIRKFINKHTQVITKHISQSVCTSQIKEDLEVHLLQENRIVGSDFLKEICSDIGPLGLPCQFQEYIEKQFELRVFYLHGKFYAMAILSQENEKTKFDFRNYDRKRPNRCVPFKLPREIKCKLAKFMKRTNLDSGSIDMIYTPHNTFVFLEVNPIGQYQWLAKNCNYEIDKKIAKHLIEQKNGNERKNKK